MLSNMHSNANSALNYSNQHFALNISPSSTTQFNQNPDQAPPSNHPVANLAAAATGHGQNYNVQKPNVIQSAPLPTSQTTVQPVANVAPQTAEQPEKSHANGTTDGESSSPLSLAQPKSSTISHSPQKLNMEVDKVSTPAQNSAAETSPATTKNADNVQNSITTPTLEVKVPTPESPTAESDEEKSNSPSPTNEEEPLEQDEKEQSESPEPEVETPIPEEPTKKETTPVADKVKAKESPPGKSQGQQAAQEAKTSAKAAPRKAKSVVDKSVAGSSGIQSSKRQRIRTQHYQSPLPEIELVSKISTTSLKNNDEKLIVFYKNEFLAVRNAEGGFYLCQAVQNIYKSSPKIRIRWLSQESQNTKGEVYTPDFYDNIDFDCILTNLSLKKADKGKFILPTTEKSRTESILNRALAVEKGEEISSPSLTEEHPDGLDLSLYRGDEEKPRKRKAKKRSRKAAPSESPKETPTKKSPKASKVRKVEPPAKKTAPKKEPAKKVPSKKSVDAETVKPNNRTSGRSSSRSSSKTSPVVDPKKAKVLARIGRKAAVAGPSKNAKSTTKNEKSGIKAIASTSKAVASTSKAVASTSKAVASTSKAVASTSKAAVNPKTSSNGKNSRTVRKSSRK